MTKSRKRMLLSSVAMLLVALIALGSATFAWYLSNQEVTASTSKFRASSADGLVIRKTVSASDTWKTEITNLAQRGANDYLAPATIDYTKNYSTVTGGTADALSATESAIDISSWDAQDHEEVMSSTNNYFFDDFWVASTGASSKTGVILEVSGSAVAATYINIAIYVDDELKGVVCSDGTTASTTNRVRTQDGETTNLTQSLVPLGNSAQVATGLEIQPKGDDLSVASGSHVQIIAFADGENSKCNSAQASMADVSLTYRFYY